MSTLFWDIFVIINEQLETSIIDFEMNLTQDLKKDKKWLIVNWKQVTSSFLTNSFRNENDKNDEINITRHNLEHFNWNQPSSSLMFTIL